MLNRCSYAFAFMLVCGVAHAEPSPRASSSTDDLRVRGEHRRLPPEVLERLRKRVRTPADGNRAAGRLARQRERAFDEAVKDPDGKGAEIAAKMQDLREHSAELRRERRRSLHARWGEAATTEKAKQELALHGSRMAKIRRMQFLAVTERKGEKRTALLERLARLKDLERGRHERAMQALAAEKPTGPAASAAAKGSAP
ncbi:MAG: hypothetical protein M3020_09730 [Myxococcota bacterium]|nr:hypothetical protein [Myxococcota bacterium]